MEFVEAGDVMKKTKTSSGLSDADEKIKLIDILSEDDEFLVASPFCDHSLQASIAELERMEEQEPRRPSFLRRSLAWDSAFFNSSGVLDPDELSFMNNGFRNTEACMLPANHEVRNRRSESESSPYDVTNFSADWFEIEPSIFESNKSSKALNKVETSPKSRLKQNVQSSKKVDGSCRNKMKSDQTSTGKSIKVLREEKLKKESEARRSNKNLPRKSNLNIGQGLVMQEKSANQSSSSAKSSSLFSSTAATASSLLKRKPELRKTPVSASLSTSKIFGHSYSERKKGMGNITTAPTHSQQLSSSSANSTSSHRFTSASLTSPVHKQRRSTDSKDVKDALNLQRSLQSPSTSAKQCALLSAKSIRPSGLRPPSPRLRFFDESTSPMNYGSSSSRNRKLPQKLISPTAAAISSSTQFSSRSSSSSSRIVPACKKLKKPFSESAKRPETVSTVVKQESSVGSHQPNGNKEVSFSVENLCRNFKAFDLESDVRKRGVNSSSRISCRRTPLAEKTSNRNSFAFALAMEPKKDKLMQRASSVRYG